MEITITLSESLREFVTAELAAGKHRDAAAYLEELLLKAENERAQERLEDLLEEGLDDTDSREWTPEVMAELKREIREYHQRANGP